MSWRKSDPIQEGFGHIIDAIKDTLPCKGYLWNNDYLKKCNTCIMRYHDIFNEDEDESCCYIKDTYNLINRIDKEENY